MLDELINQPCTLTARHPSAEVDRYGNEIVGEVEIPTVCNVQQKDASEEPDQELGRGDYRGFFLIDEDLQGVDKVEVDGIGTFEVAGPPDRLWDPFTNAYDHIEADLVKVADEERAS